MLRRKTSIYLYRRLCQSESKRVIGRSEANQIGPACLGCGRAESEMWVRSSCASPLHSSSGAGNDLQILKCNRQLCTCRSQELDRYHYNWQYIRNPRFSSACYGYDYGFWSPRLTHHDKWESLSQCSQRTLHVHGRRCNDDPEDTMVFTLIYRQHELLTA